MANPIVAPLVLAGLTTMITSYFQNRSAKLKVELAHRESELEKANAIFVEISELMSSFSAYNRESMFALVLERDDNQATVKQEDKRAWDNYEAALTQWQKSKIRQLAQVKSYFGDDALKLLEKVDTGFRILEEQVAATFFGRTSSKYFLEDDKGGKNDFRTKYFKVYDPLEGEIFALSELMIQAIQQEKVGSLGRIADRPPL